MCALEDQLNNRKTQDDSVFLRIDQSLVDVREEDQEIFNKNVESFLPDEIFDAHAHWYHPSHLQNDIRSNNHKKVGYQTMKMGLDLWMGDREHDGLYFPFPVKWLDCELANNFLETELSNRPDSRGLMIIRPDDNPDRVKQNIIDNQFCGFKVYHVFSDRKDTFNANQEEFMPEWAWEIADQHDLWITMHIVKKTGLSDPSNWQYIRKFCLKYPNVKFVLAHAARGFNASHTCEAIHFIKDLDNVFFDSSAICEPAALEAILKATGSTRLMYGSDYPVCQLRGKAISVGDGFTWLYDHNTDWKSSIHGLPTLVGIESLLALKQACRTLCLKDDDLERIFSKNAKQLLNIEKQPSPNGVLEQYAEAKKIIPGGTQLLSKRPEMFAPDIWPAYAEQAKGCEIIDTSGNRYIDMSLNGILACILGYSDPDINEAVLRRVHLGSMSTLSSYDEVRLAELLIEIHPWAEMARFTRTGGESTSVAIRIARAATGRDKIAICGYHSWQDWYLAANLGEEGTAGLENHLLSGLEPNGVPQGLKNSVLTFQYNDMNEVKHLFEKHGNELAAVIMEPTRTEDPHPGFLECIRDLTEKNDVKLIFDEISIGWRLCLGGAHLLYGVNPDMAVFAKTISNGFAMGAVIGNKKTMQAAQNSFISSAYWTEGIGPAASVACIEKMKKIDVPSHLSKIGKYFQMKWKETGEKFNLPVFSKGRPELVQVGFDHQDANALMTLFTIRMLKQGFLASSAFNPTLAHQIHHVDDYFSAAGIVFEEIHESLEKQDVFKRINHKPKHTGFSRLVN